MENFKISDLAGRNDAAMAVGVIGILLIMILPLPTLVLDILLSFNITISILILLISMYTLKPLEFSVFPTILLVTTLFRLSLNVASTRLVLLNGNEGVGAAGQVIKSFGYFVIGGNYFVGVVVFTILVVINFVVITKGAGRIAEVAARFTLDAMPGKQMSIDADLNAGLINETEARERRLNIAHEAEFYGAMDGSSKFVRGEAVAGMVIMFVNIIGGFLIGIMQHKMTLIESARTYTLLSIGDGLVSQIPALIVSTAAGIVTTRSASDSTLGEGISKQLLTNSKALGATAMILTLLGLVPGLPHIPFLILGSLAGAASYMGLQKKETDSKAIEMEKTSERQEVKIESLLPLDVLELQVGYGLIPLIDTTQDGELLERVKSIRRQFASEMGIIVPSIHISDNLQFKPGQYSIIIKGAEVASGDLLLGHYLALNSGTIQGKIDGIPTKEPAFGLPGMWITEREKERAQLAGYTVVDLSSVIATHLTEVIRAHAQELLGRQEVQTLLENVSKSKPKVVEELIPGLLSLGAVVKVLQNLLREQVPIRDMVTIIETLADYATMTKDPDILTEYVRQSLSRIITKKYQTSQGDIPLMLLDQKIEEIIEGSIQHTPQGSYLALEPGVAQQVLNRLAQAVITFTQKNYHPIILCSPVIRSHLRKLLERYMPNLVVLSHKEISPNVKIQSLDVVSISDAI